MAKIQKEMSKAELANQRLEREHDEAMAKQERLEAQGAAMEAAVDGLRSQLTEAEANLGQNASERSDNVALGKRLQARLADPLGVLTGSPDEVLSQAEYDKTCGCDVEAVQAIVDQWANRKIHYQTAGGLPQSKFVNASRVWICYRRDSGQVIDHEILATATVDQSYHNSKWGATFAGYRFDANERLNALRRQHGLQIETEPLPELIVEPCSN